MRHTLRWELLHKCDVHANRDFDDPTELQRRLRGIRSRVLRARSSALLQRLDASDQWLRDRPRLERFDLLFIPVDRVRVHGRLIASQGKHHLQLLDGICVL